MKKLGLLGATAIIILISVYVYWDSPRPKPAPRLGLEPTTSFCGIADLHPVGRAANSEILSRPEIDWLVARVRWSKLEPTEGNYDFSYLENELELARALGKKTVLRIIAGRGSPDWILNDPAIPKVSFFRANQENERSFVTVPAPWNPIYEAGCRRLFDKVAAELGDSFNLVSISCTDSAVGLFLGPDSSFDDWVRAGYSPAVYEKTVKGYIDFFNSRFPNRPLLFHLGVPWGDRAITQNLIDYGKTLVGQDRFILFAENLKASFENEPEPDGKRQMMVDYARSGGRIGYQSVWPITADPQNANHCQSNETKENCLSRAIEAGLADGACYFELYEEDIAALGSTVQKFWNELKLLL